jgi:hypothetical protein
LPRLPGGSRVKLSQTVRYRNREETGALSPSKIEVYSETRRIGLIANARKVSSHVLIHSLMRNRSDALLMLQRPDSKFRPVRHSELPKNAIEIFLNSSFGQMQFVGNFLVQLRLADQCNYLPLAKTQTRIEILSLIFPWAPAIGADFPSSTTAEIVSATKAATKYVHRRNFKSGHK